MTDFDSGGPSANLGTTAINWDLVAEYSKTHTVKECCIKYHIAGSSWCGAVWKGLIPGRKRLRRIKQAGYKKPWKWRNEDWTAINDYWLNHSRLETMAKYHISFAAFRRASDLGFLRCKKLTLDIIAVKNSRHCRGALKGYLIKSGKIAYVCAVCGINPTWNGKQLVLILDHINGIRNDHRLENIRFVCPNCNSQLLTYCGRNTSKAIAKRTT